MALLWSDGFDRYTAAADFALTYTRNAGAFGATAGKTGGGAWQTTSFPNAITRTFSPAGALTLGGNVHVCFWFKVVTIPTSTVFFCKIGTNIANTASSNPAWLNINPDGSIAATIHNAATILATSAVGVITANTFAHIEYAARYNTAGNGGFIKVWVNGNIVINFSGTTQSGTVPTTFTDLLLGNTGDGVVRTFDDLIVWDENGTDFALTQMTTAYLPVIETLAPDANDTVQFTPSAGSNFQNVDETGFHNGDTDYNSSSVVGQADQFTVANQATTPLYTFAIALKTVAKIDIAGTINLRSRLLSGASVVDSADRLLGLSYALYADFFGKDPATTAIWTTTQANNVKCGYKYQS